MKNREEKGTLALVVLAIVLALLMLSPMVVHAATPTEEVITEEEFKKRGLKLGTTTYDDGNYITITTVKVITGNPNGSYVVTTEKIPTGGGNCPDRYGYDYYGYGYDDYYYGGYDDYYGYGYGYGYSYSRSELREIARDDFADTGIKRLAKKKHGKVTWTVKEVTDYDLVAKITVRNRRNKKKVFYQYTDGEETFFETQSGREIDEDDIKDFLRR